MRSVSRFFAAVLSFSLFGGAAASAAGEGSFASRTQVSLMGGFQTLDGNHTALPDAVVNLPLAAALAYRLTPNYALEGELSWIIPIEQDVTLASGATESRKTPDVLVYQANLRGGLSIAPWTPYLVAGLGAITFLSSTGGDRLLQLNESQTMFAINFGAGFVYDLTARVALRADFREFGAFPGSDAVGFSNGGDTNAIWMERGTLGVAFRF